MKTLPELQAAHLPRLDWRELLVGKDLTPDEEQTLADYFQHFVIPGPCIKCGAQQGGKSEIDALLGLAHFRWGIAHGEGQCSVEGCGYPARALHYDVGPIKRLNLILQYHPDEVHSHSEKTGHDC